MGASRPAFDDAGERTCDPRVRGTSVCAWRVWLTGREITFEDAMTRASSSATSSKPVIKPISASAGTHISDIGPETPHEYSRRSMVPPSSDGGRLESAGDGYSRLAPRSSSVHTPGSGMTQRLGSGGKPLKESLLEYIANEDPTWKRDAKLILRRFSRLLRAHFPNIVENLGVIHRRPFASYGSNVGAQYLSLNNSQSFSPPALSRGMRKRQRGIRPSWSCIDLRTFGTRLGVSFSFENEDGGVDRLPEERRHVRSNSFNARFDLTGYTLRKKIVPTKQHSDGESGDDSEELETTDSESDSDSDFDDLDVEEVYCPLEVLMWLVPLQQGSGDASQYNSQVLWR